MWPNPTIDATVKIQGGENQALVPYIAHTLVASSFYLEFEGRSAAKSTTVYVSVRCRLPPGPTTVDFVAKLRLRKYQFFYSSDSNVTASCPVCPPNIWKEVRDGQQFRQLLRIEMGSLGSAVDVRLGGPSEASISNCPSDLSLLRSGAIGVMTRNQAEKTSESLELLQRTLASMQI